MFTSQVYLTAFLGIENQNFIINHNKEQIIETKMGELKEAPKVET